MTIKKIHPDFPEFDTAQDSWDMAAPVSDIQNALQYARGDKFQIAEIDAITDYSIFYNGQPWQQGDEYGTELEMSLIGTLVDGRHFSLSAGNDYTGWGCCGDDAEIYIGATRQDVLSKGLTNEMRRALGVELPGATS